DFVRFPVDRRPLFGCEIRALADGLALERHALERHQLVLDEATNEILEHLMLFAEGKVHLRVSTPMRVVEATIELEAQRGALFRGHGDGYGLDLERAP